MKKIILQLVDGITVHHLPAVEKDSDVYLLAENKTNQKMDGCLIHGALSYYNANALRLRYYENCLSGYTVYTPSVDWSLLYFEAIALPEDVKAALLEIKADLESHSQPTNFTLVSC